MPDTVLGLEEQRTPNRPSTPLRALYFGAGRQTMNTWIASQVTPKTLLCSGISISIYRCGNQAHANGDLSKTA